MRDVIEYVEVPLEIKSGEVYEEFAKGKSPKKKTSNFLIFDQKKKKVSKPGTVPALNDNGKHLWDSVELIGT